MRQVFVMHPACQYLYAWLSEELQIAGLDYEIHLAFSSDIATNADYFPILARAIRLAISAAVAPAPTPLSILTTVNPGAHVWSIASNAARPFPPAP